MRAPNSNVRNRNKRQEMYVKRIRNNSLQSVDKGARIYRIRVPLLVANAL